MEQSFGVIQSVLGNRLKYKELTENKLIGGVHPHWQFLNNTSVDGFIRRLRELICKIYTKI